MLHSRTNIFILFTLIVFSFFIPLGLTPLFDLDEGAFSEATREMFVSGDYLTTYLNGELRFDKPILIYYLQLISIKIFGLHTFAFRLPSAIAATLWAGVVYIFTSRYFKKQSAFLATLFFITALQTTIIAKAAIADALLNLFIALSLVCIYEFYKNRQLHFIYLAFLFIALGTLTKGPVAILIPFMVSGIFFVWQKEFKLWFQSILNLVGIGIFIVVALPWYVLEYLEQGQLFIDGFFLKHNISRMANAMEGHGGGFYYFFLVLIVGFLPYTYLVVKVFWKIKEVYKDELGRFLLIWFLSVFIFFSFSSTKLPHYIIYGYTPLFILCAMQVQAQNKKYWIIAPILSLSLLFLFLPEIASVVKPYIKDNFVLVLIEHANKSFGYSYRFILGAIIGICIFTLYKKTSFEKTLIIGGFLMVLLVNYAVMPAYGRLMQEPVKEAALLAKKSGFKVVMYKNNMPSFNVYYEGLVSKKKPIKNQVVFCKIIHLKDFVAYDTLYKKNGFALIRIKE